MDRGLLVKQAGLEKKDGLATRWILEKSNKYGNSPYLCFIGYRQVPDFDDKSSFFPFNINDAIQYINLGHGAQQLKSKRQATNNTLCACKMRGQGNIPFNNVNVGNRYCTFINCHCCTYLKIMEKKACCSISVCPFNHAQIKAIHFVPFESYCIRIWG